MAAALVNPHLLGPLSHNYASLVVCLDLLWCIWVRTYTREWGPRGQDRNLESPRKSTLDFREAVLIEVILYIQVIRLIRQDKTSVLGLRSHTAVSP